MENKVFKEEENYLSSTIQAIKEEIKIGSDFVENQKDVVLDLKQSYLKNLRDYDRFEFLENYARSDEIVDLANQQIKKLFRLRNVQDKPYFGRIDFLVNGEKEPLRA